MKERISWIDIARGLGIIFVIYAHALDKDSIRFYIYSFHMPLFFFLSGLVFHIKKEENYYQFVKKTTKNIFIPYLLFAYLGYLLWFFTLNSTSFTFPQILTQLMHLLYGSGKDPKIIYNNILWFLPCLFVTRIAFAGIMKWTQNRSVLFLILCICSVSGYFLTITAPKLMLPFGAEIALNGIVFFGLGYIFKTLLPSFQTHLKKYALPFFFTFLALSILVATYTYSLYQLQIDMRLSRLNNYYLFYAGSLTGIFAWTTFSILLKKNRLLEYIGSHTLILFAWHLFVFSYLTRFLVLFIPKRTIDLHHNTYFAILYTVISITVLLILSELYKKSLTLWKSRRTKLLS